MSFIGKNIKKIRVVKKMSQSDFAHIFDLARPSVGAYEEGRAEPKIETLIQIAKHFQLSIDTLLTKELTINELYKFDIFKEEFRKDGIDRPVDKDAVKEQTPLVTLDQDLEYIVNHTSKDYVNKLPVIQFPYTQSKKSRAFQIDGGEMEYENCGLHHKDILLCSPVENHKKLKANKVYVIVTKKSILTRRFKKSSSGMLHFKPDNTAYDALELSPEDILELWMADAYFSANLKSPTRVEERVNYLEEKLKRIEDMLDSK